MPYLFFGSLFRSLSLLQSSLLTFFLRQLAFDGFIDHSEPHLQIGDALLVEDIIWLPLVFIYLR